VTTDVALRLSRAFDTTPELWLNLLRLEELRRLAAPTYEDRPMDVDIEVVAGEISEKGFPKENGWKSRNQKVTM
jgi:plasmid maintenance system antidote protein VapI